VEELFLMHRVELKVGFPLTLGVGFTSS